MTNTPAKTTNAAPATQGAGDMVGTTGDRGVRQAGELSSKYTPRELDALRALGGLDEASDGDLDMLSAVAERTGLDPFLREVWLIGRKTKTGGYRGEPERWETKWTVQVGIDGFRKVSRRYADQLGKPLNIGSPTFYDAEGVPRPFWSKKFGDHPEAAEITVSVGDSSATHVVTWDEYVQTNKNGQPNAQWKQYGPTQLAKCAEAGAHRRVCSLTSGLYEPAEIKTVEAVRTDTAAPRGSGAQGSINQIKERLAVESAPADVDAYAQPEPAAEREKVPAEADPLIRAAESAEVAHQSFQAAVDATEAADMDAAVGGFVDAANAAETLEALSKVFEDADAQFANGSPELNRITEACNARLKAEGWEL